MTIDSLKLMTKKELAALLNVSVRTLDRWRNLNKVPKSITIGRGAGWVRSIIEQWMKEECPSGFSPKGDR